MSHFYRSEICGSHVVLLFVWLGAISLFTDGGNITWLEPPPFETVTDTSMISRTNKQVIQGSLNEELSCNFSLTLGLEIRVVAIKFRSRPAVTFVPNVFLRVEPVFAKRFNAVWVPNRLTLIFSNVTDAEKGEYCCQVVTIGRSPRTWIRKIQLLVVDPSQAMAPSTTVPQNLIQTTVSAITASKDQRQTTSSFLSNHDSIQTTDYSITASEGGNPGAIIGAVIGVIAFCFIAIPTVCFWKREKCSKTFLYTIQR